MNPWEPQALAGLPVDPYRGGPTIENANLMNFLDLKKEDSKGLETPFIDPINVAAGGLAGMATGGLMSGLSQLPGMVASEVPIGLGLEAIDEYSGSNPIVNMVAGLALPMAAGRYFEPHVNQLANEAYMTAARLAPEIDPSLMMNSVPIMEALAQGRLGEAAGNLSMIGWHGSPFKWEVPDISKLGTGEGAQSYGHGFYSAEEPAVAMEYFRKLRPEGGDSYLYKLDIPDEQVARYLDWDALIDEQSPQVMQNLENMEGWDYILEGLFDRADMAGTNPTGGDFHSYMLEDYFPDELAEMLNKSGIPGIKYLDAGSRNVGEGTRNFVSFDPSGIKVLERKGFID